MNNTELVAWWGAIVATLLLFFELFKWKTQGAKLGMILSPNIEIYNNPERENITWVLIKITNNGDRPTTINGVGYHYYSNSIKRLFKKTSKSAYFPNPSDAHPLPQVLNPGQEWIGFVPQYIKDKGVDLVEMSNKGYLIFWVYSSDKPRPMTKRLSIKFE